MNSSYHFPTRFRSEFSSICEIARDKFRSGGSGGNRISEFNRAAIGALGGWPGGLLAMLPFRHKTAKLSFKLKYGIAFVIWAGLIYAAFVWLRR